MLSKWKKVGVIGVDAGLCWIGDPCYVVAKDCDEQFKSWHAFCDQLGVREKDGVSVFPYKLGHEGLGIAVSTGYGDGEYDVFVKRDKSGRIAEAKVVFIEE